MKIDKNKFKTLALIALNGYVGLAVELLVLRQVASFAGATAAISSIIIGIYLGAMTVGYFAGGRRSRRDAGRTISFSFLCVAALIILTASYPLVSDYFYLMTLIGIVSHIAQTFIYALLFLFAAGVLFGFNTATLAEVLHDQNQDKTGIIMGVGTIGSVLGSLITTLILMAILGVNYTIIITVAMTLAGAFVAHRRWWVAVASIVIIAMAWLGNNGEFLRKKYGIVSNNAENTVAVFESLGARYLMVDSAIHSVISSDGKIHARYINYINRHFINSIPAGEVKDILVLGAGGFTVGHPDNRNNYTFVDIDRAMLKVAEKYFLRKKLSENKKFVVQDAGQFLKTADKKYDLIIMDVFSRWSIPESAITVEFMSRMRSRLLPGGIIVMNIIANPTFGDTFARKLDNTIRAVFPQNLTRQVIDEYDGWAPDDDTNLLYIYFDAPNDGAVYTPDKNSTIYDKKTIM